MSNLSKLAVAALLSARALAFPADGLDKRTGTGMQCNEDNVLRAMEHRTPDSWAFCSSYISLPSATTVTATTGTNTVTATHSVTATIHPFAFYNLQRYTGGSTISYASPASPSTIPGGGCDYPHGGYCSAMKAQGHKRTIEARQTTAAPSTTTGTIPSYLATVPASRISSGCSCLNVPYATTITVSTNAVATTTASCTTYSALPTTTMPYFCAPTLQINAPSIAPATSNITVAKPVSAKSKMDCCQACSNIFNCVWWKFDFAKPNADGSGDPWAAGTCTYAFNTVNDQTDYNPAAVCPNGNIGGFFQGQSPSGLEAANNLPGYNPGPCGGGYDILQSSLDGGYPDNYYQSQCR